MKHHIFISYSRRDTDVMQKLSAAFAANQLTVWTDEGILPGAPSWKAAIEDAVVSAGCVVCILSPDSKQSRWVGEELTLAEIHRKLIFPVLARGTDQTSVPLGLLTAQWIDLRDESTAEPRLNQLVATIKTLVKSEITPSTSTSSADLPPDRETRSSTARISKVSIQTSKPEVQPDAFLTGRAEPAIWQPKVIKFRPMSDATGTALNRIISPDTPPAERMAAGKQLDADVSGDPRLGVGLRMDSIPDIDWVKIREGEFIYQAGERRNLPTFFIARYPITYIQYQAFIDDSNGYAQDKWWSGLAVRQGTPGEQAFKRRNHPRDHVSWYDAVAYCRWLSDRLSYAVRLPSDTEWEKAARGEEGRAYPWGNEFREGYANTDKLLLQTSAVGIFAHARSPYDVLDTTGNVWEWCSGLYDDPENNDLDEVGQRILRGGSWYNPHVPTYFRAAGDADGRTELVGFRVARSAPSN